MIDKKVKKSGMGLLPNKEKPFQVKRAGKKLNKSVERFGLKERHVI